MTSLRRAVSSLFTIKVAGRGYRRFVRTDGQGATVEATIYNLAGQPVRTLTAYGQIAGANRSLAWDGRDESRRPVAPGLYLCELKTETNRGRFARTTSVGVAY